jgi:hypothetical protein
MGMRHLTIKELEAGLAAISQSPRDGGVLQSIVRRPQSGQREVLEGGELNLVEFLVGDNWRTRRSSRTPDGSLHPDMQLNIMKHTRCQRFAARFGLDATTLSLHQFGVGWACVASMRGSFDLVSFGLVM